MLERGACAEWVPLLILNRRHLERVLRVYVAHYNREPPHRALELQPPEPKQRKKDHLSLRSGAATDSVASSTSTTGPPREAPGA